ncbi:MAG: RrF2 family transcriptional regulator [Planctomycetota bacterium]
MNLSTRGRYGARAMVELVNSSRETPLDVKTIADRQEIPVDYLGQILHSLRKAGLVKSIRGVRGGYILAKPASRITVMEILRVLEKTMTPVGCIDDPDYCERRIKCPTRVLWKKLKRAISGVLASTTLDELAKDCRNKN